MRRYYTECRGILSLLGCSFTVLALFFAQIFPYSFQQRCVDNLLAHPIRDACRIPVTTPPTGCQQSPPKLRRALALVRQRGLNVAYDPVARNSSGGTTHGWT